MLLTFKHLAAKFAPAPNITIDRIIQTSQQLAEISRHITE